MTNVCLHKGYGNKWTAIVEEMNKTERKSHELGLSKEFLDLTSKAQSIKKKSDKLEYTNIKNLGWQKTTLRE